MHPEQLQAVEEIGLADVWEHEEQDFTPWLIDHIDELATTIGIEVDDVERERSVGGYRADVIATEMNTDGGVVIENQFGDTDHDHLGKLLTYAAGTDADFVIWLSESFRDEHRSVLEWLNSGNGNGAMFFGVRPRVVLVSGEVGFEFTLVVEPNDWERELRDPRTPREKAYAEFFNQLTEAYSQRNPDWNRLKAQPQSWLAFGAGIGGVRFSWSFHQGPEFSTELYIDTGDGERNDEMFLALKENEQAVEESLGEVVWQRLPEKRACRIKVAREISTSIEGLEASERAELVNWGAKRMDQLRSEFEPRLDSI